MVESKLKIACFSLYNKAVLGIISMGKMNQDLIRRNNYYE